MGRHYKLSIIFFILILKNCFGGTIDPLNSDADYLDYGKDFYCVAKVVGDGDYYASAVIIGNNTFITNAHVADKIKKIILEKKDNFLDFKITKIIIHKEYVKNSHNNDIAIGKISGNFNLESYPELYKDKNELSKLVSICGYGATGNFSTGKNRSDKKRRAGTNIIFERSELILYCSAKDVPKTKLEFLICHGDSGGGLFIDKKLAGINCFIDTKDGTYNSNYNDNTGYIRISEYVDWIENFKK